MEYQDYVKKVEESGLADVQVYRLCGADVMSVLEDRGMFEKLSREELFDIVSYVGRKLEIPWTEYVEAAIEMYVLRKEEMKE